MTTDQTNWAALTHAYGSAEDVPGHLAALESDDAEQRRVALDALWSSLCHQGTVYEASRAAVPALASLMSKVRDVEVRVDVAILLGCIAGAWTNARRFDGEWRDATLCRDAATEHAAVLLHAIDAGPFRVRVAMLVVAAAIAEPAPELARATVRALPQDSDVRLTEACRLLLLLADDVNKVTVERVRAAASVDEETVDYVEGTFGDEPVSLAVEVVLELASRVLASPEPE